MQDWESELVALAQLELPVSFSRRLIMIAR